jgi:hypothetical protein
MRGDPGAHAKPLPVPTTRIRCTRVHGAGQHESARCVRGPETADRRWPAGKVCTTRDRTSPRFMTAERTRASGKCVRAKQVDRRSGRAADVCAAPRFRRRRTAGACASQRQPAPGGRRVWAGDRSWAGEERRQMCAPAKSASGEAADVCAMRGPRRGSRRLSVGAMNG